MSKESKAAVRKMARLLDKYECCEHDFEALLKIADTILCREITPQDFHAMLNGAMFSLCEPEAEAEEAANQIIKKAQRGLKK